MIKVEIFLERPMQFFGLGIAFGEDDGKMLMIILGCIGIKFSKKYKYQKYFYFINNI